MWYGELNSLWILLILLLIYIFYLLYENKKLIEENKNLNNIIQQKTIEEHKNLTHIEILEKKILDYEYFFTNRENIFKEKFINLSQETLNQQTDLFLKRMDIFLQHAIEKQKYQSDNFLKLIEPVSTSMEYFKQQTINMEQERKISHQLLHKSIEQMNNMCLKIKEQMVLLTSSNKMSGKWGEIQLKRILEMTGLLSHCDFLEQYHIEREEGNIRPDILINLPDNIYITIDAKTSLTSYIKYKESMDEENKKKHKKEYYKSIRSHITTLGSKKYWSQFKTSPEMVIMFLPGEDFWSLAMDEDGEIMEYAYSMNVIVSTPLTLIPLLRIISLLWSKYKLSVENEDLSNKTLLLYEQFTKINQIITSMSKNISNLNDYNNKVIYLQKNINQNLEQIREKFFPNMAK